MSTHVERITCMHCGHQVATYYVTCPYCGYQPGENQPPITDPFYCEFGSM